MRTSGMIMAVLTALTLCIGCGDDKPKPGTTPAKDTKTTTPPPAAGFTHDAWLCWASFDVGAWVEMETGGNKMKTTITSKDDKEVKGERMGMKDQVLASKVANEKCGYPDCTKKVSEHCMVKHGTCTKKGAHCCDCDKHKAADVKWSKEDVKVGDQTLKCDVSESTAFDCKGEKGATSKMWFSKEVPGWMVKTKAGQTEMTTIGFGKK